MPQDRACKKKHPNPAQHFHECRLCRLLCYEPGFAEAWGEPVPPNLPPKPDAPERPGRNGKQLARRENILTKWRSQPCIYLGDKTGEIRECSGCGNQGKTVELNVCSIHGTCTYDVAKTAKGVRSCNGCPDYRITPVLPPITPLRDRQVTGLIETKHATNCSILRWKGKTIFAYRIKWRASEIILCELDDDLRVVPGTSKQLELQGRHPFCEGSREDPRLFVHGGRLHVGFVGVYRFPPDTESIVCRFLFARLTDSWDVEEVWEADYPDRQPMEKNWQPFSHDGQFYAIYGMQPWKVLKIDASGPDHKAEWLPSANPWMPYSRGHARGGAPPVRHGNEYYCFFHGTDIAARPAVYSVGVATFEAEPPFRLIRCSREPIVYPAMDRLPQGWRAATAFPCGAYLREDGKAWVISYGDNDHYSRVMELSVQDVEDKLMFMDWIETPHLRPPTRWSWPDGGKDYEVGQWLWIVGKDEYRMRSLDLNGGIVLDVGAYAGTFAWLALTRGASQVYCYEPDPESHESLVRNLEGSQAFIHRIGVGGHRSSSRIEAAYSDERTSRRLGYSDDGDILVVSLDDAIRSTLSDSKSKRIRLLKMDCEGAEWASLLRTDLLWRIDSIRAELHWGSDADYDALKAKLEDEGFVVSFHDRHRDGSGHLVADRTAPPPIRRVLFSGTLDEMIAQEAQLATPEKRSVRQVYVAGGLEADWFADLLKCCPTWRDKPVARLGDDLITSKQEAEREFGELFDSASVVCLASRERGYTRSAFLTDEIDLAAATTSFPEQVEAAKLLTEVEAGGDSLDWKVVLAAKFLPPSRVSLHVPKMNEHYVSKLLGAYTADQVPALDHPLRYADDPRVRKWEHRTMLCPTRLGILMQFLDHAQQAHPGPVAEVGVANGGVCLMMKDAYPHQDCYAFDTFRGMPESVVDRSIQEQFGEDSFVPLSNTVPMLRRAGVIICAGVFPQTVTEEIHQRTFSLVHLDCDTFRSMRDALEFFWSRTAGYLVVDDWNRLECPGVVKALEDWNPNYEQLVVYRDAGNCQIVLKGGAS